MESQSNYKLTREQIKEGYREEKGESSVAKKAMIASLIGLTSVATYKSGVLKKPISKMIKMANGRAPTLPTAATGVKSWLKGIDEDSKSIFRRKFSETFKELKESTDKNKSFKNITKETIGDIKDLKQTVGEYVKKAKEAKKHREYVDYRNTDLVFNLHKKSRVARRYKGKAREKADFVMSQELVKKFSLDPKQAKIKNERTGHRQLTLGDVLVAKLNKNGRVVIANKREDFSFDKDTLEEIETFIKKTKAKDKDGNFIRKENGKFKSIFESGDYKNIVIDSDILISEKGEISDIRNVVRSMQGFTRSAANDFKIPFVGINPLRFFGLGEFGKKPQIFETLHPDTVQNSITKTLGKKTLRETGFTDERLLFANGKVFKYDKNIGDFGKIGDGYNVRKYMHGKTVDKKLDDFRKIADIEIRKYDEYTKEDGFFNYYKGKASKFFDIGRQESKVPNYEESVLSSTSPDSFIEKLSNKASEKARFTKGMSEGDIEDAFGNIESEIQDKEDIYIAIKKHIKFKDVLDPLNDKKVRDYFSQFFKGRKKIDDVTESTLTTYHLFERMNQAFKPFGIALGNDSIGSIGDVLKNLLLKRFLPIYMGYQGIEYLTYLSEGEDEEGNKTNMKMDAANAVAKLQLGATKVKDAIGITSLAKSIKENVPGSEYFFELPIIKNLGLERNYEEQKEWFQTGMEAVRKGRYWGLGNTPFIGGKISYYRPNWYRSTIADADFSENKYGSRKEYFDNAWFPTPTSPFAPLNHFVFDKYHYESKHYKDRPYLMTSPMFENVPIFGKFLSGTIGKIIKPQKRMHEEYWNSEYGTNSIHSDSIDINYNSETNQENIYENSKSIITNTNPNNIIEGNQNYKTIERKGSTLGVLNDNLGDGKEVYITNSGNIGFVDVDRRNIYKIRKDIQNTSPKSMIGVNTSVSKSAREGINATINENQNFIDKDGNEIINPYSFKNVISEQYRDTTNVLGLYGYLANTYVTGETGSGQTVIDTPGYAYSFNKTFWDKELGGFGGDISEIFRRFVQKRRTDVEYYNPIRNTQPDWMPGEGAFINFKEGDPFAKIPNGEIRLSGTPYERIWGIKDPLKLGIGSSFIGKTKDEIIDHFLRNDTITDSGLLDIVEDGTEKHEKIEQEWLKSGLAIDVEGKVEDKANNILGFYDARIRDKTAKHGEAIVDIKTISKKGFDEVVRTGKAKELHQKQVNYYLWATDRDKGYVHYVNRENPNERYSVGFKFNKKMLDESLQTLKEAREEILRRYENGEISRGDLYKPIDRFRILADISPWSQEYAEMDKVLRASGMDEETKKQYDEIKERVKQQKKPHNNHEYMYKHSDVTSVSTKITKIENNDIYTEFSGDSPIRLAGLNLGINGSKEEDEKIKEVLKRIKVGARVNLLVAEDEVQRNKNKRMKAVLIDSKNVNINKELLNKNLAEEDKDDWSAPGVHARFNKAKIVAGSIWERFAHMDTPLHTKLLQVRSAKEDYERREVYGKDFAKWQNPVRDYLKPAIYSAINRPAGVFFGGLLGSMFGRTKYGKLVGGTIGVATVLIGKGVTGAKQLATGERWIPKPIRKERELVEYMDMLEYIKNRKLYNEYKVRSLEEEGFDLDEYENREEINAQKRKGHIRKLEKQKVPLKEEYKKSIKDREKHEEIKVGKVFKPKTAKEKITAPLRKLDKALYDNKTERLDKETKRKRKELLDTNKEINNIKSYRKIDILPPLATKALEYKEKAEKTLYGYDVGEPLTNLLSALPKIDRDRFNDFVNAPEEERHELLTLVPKYVKRGLQAAWDMEVDKKPELDEYFKTHQLPDEEWIGWDENVNLDAIKVKMINKEGLDYSDFNIWDDQIKEADRLQGVPLPSINFKNRSVDIKNRLNKILGSMGLENVDIKYRFTGDNATVNLNLVTDDKDEIEEKINEYNFIN